MNRKKITRLILGAVMIFGFISLVPVITNAEDTMCDDPHGSYQTPEGTIDWGKFGEYISKCAKGDDLTIGDLITNGFNAILAWVFNKVAYLMTWIMAWESALIGDMLGPRYFQFASSPLVHTGWYVSLQIANLALVLGLLIVADKIIIGAEQLGDYKKLITYAAVALFINFSLVLIGTVIGLSNAVTYYFLGLSGSPAEISQRLLQISNVYSAMMADSDNMLVGFIVGFIGTNILVLLVLIFGAILFTTFTRIIKLWIAMIFAPLAIVLGHLNLGFGESAWSQWKKEFGKAIMFPPIMAFFLWFTFMVMDKSKQLFIEGRVDNDFWLFKLMEAGIFTAFLVFGYGQAISMSGASMGALDNMIKKTGELWGISKVPGKIPGKIEKGWNKTKEFIGKTGAYQELVAAAKKRIADSGLAQSIRSKTAGMPILSRIPKVFDKWGSEADKSRSGRSATILSEMEYGIGSIERSRGRAAAITHLEGLMRESSDPAERAAAIKLLSTRYKSEFKKRLEEKYGKSNAGLAAKYQELYRLTSLAKQHGVDFSVGQFDAELAHGQLSAIPGGKIQEKDMGLFMEATEKFATDDFEKFRKKMYEKMKGELGEGMEDHKKIGTWIQERYQAPARVHGKGSLLEALKGIDPLLEDVEKRRTFIRSKSGDYLAGLAPALLYHEDVLSGLDQGQVRGILEVADYGTDDPTKVNATTLLKKLVFTKDEDGRTIINPDTEGLRRNLGLSQSSNALIRSAIVDPRSGLSSKEQTELIQAFRLDEINKKGGGRKKQESNQGEGSHQGRQG